MRWRNGVLAALVGLCTLTAVQEVLAQAPLFTDVLPKEEFAERRARVMQQIGDAAAIIQGSAEYPAFIKFRQNNQFFYLSGVEVPRAILVIDGRRKQSTLYIPPRNEPLERMEGAVLIPGEEAVRVTGIERVLPRDEFAGYLVRLGQERRTLYLPFQPETRTAGTGKQALDHAAATAADPWDGRPSREAAFFERVRAHVPQLELANLDPILFAMRQIKSPREIAIVREAARIAGLAMMEAMRSASVGMYEYELEAVGDYIFKKHNARGGGYYALVAAGKNALYPHYHANQAQLGDGDLVLYDYAPDYKYYTLDVTRVFPANGRFSAAQRELYTAYLRVYQSLIVSVRPHATQAEILKDAVKRMEAALATHHVSDPKHREAVARFVDSFRGADGWLVSHEVGMEVHDPSYPEGPLKPGMVFSIEPSLRIPEDGIYIRLQDAIVVTDTGYENLSGFVPVEADAIERLMAEEGPNLGRKRGEVENTRPFRRSDTGIHLTGFARR